MEENKPISPYIPRWWIRKMYQVHAAVECPRCGSVDKALRDDWQGEIPGTIIFHCVVCNETYSVVAWERKWPKSDS